MVRKKTEIKNDVMSQMVAAANGDAIEKRVEVKLKDKLMQHGVHTVY